MDDFLSGRERVGDKPAPKKTDSRNREEALGKLELPESSGHRHTEEAEGEAGSRVSYVTEGGRVTKIVVTCACGQVTEIDCNYEA